MPQRLLTGIAAFATLAVIGAASGQAPPALRSQNIVTNLNFPTFATHAPGDKCRLFVTEKRGAIKVVDITSPTPFVIGTFLDIDSLVLGSTSVGGEQGLLGLAFHPDYRNNGYFFVNYTNNSGSTVVARYQVSANPNVANPSSALILLTVAQPFSNHNGGWIDFGPDGYLYIAMGDGGSGGDPSNNAQNLNTKLGKMLRINPNVAGSSPAYTIPPTNPFASGGGDATIWAYGLRNPWRNSFDSLTGDLYIGDVGQGAREEINFQPANSTGGENYGWRCREGNLCTGAAGCPACPNPAWTDPIRVYNYAAGTANGRCVIGGYMYRGCAIPGLQGFYIHGDYVNSNFWAMRYTQGGGVTDHTLLNSQLTPSLTGTAVNSLSSFAEDGRGEIYIVKHSSTTAGGLFRIVAASGVDACVNPVVDFNSDGQVDGNDLGELLGLWGPGGGYGKADFNCDGQVDGNDLGTLLGGWSS